jgi:hypothetical protein
MKIATKGGKMLKKCLQLVMIGVVATLFSACFEVDETVVLNADGSGRADIAVRMAMDDSKKTDAAKPTTTMLEGVGSGQGLTVGVPKLVQGIGQTVMGISVTAPKFSNFTNLYKQESKSGDKDSNEARDAFSKNEFYTIKKVGKDRLKITRTFMPTKAAKKEAAKGKKKDALDMDFSSMMSGFCHFDLNVPTQIYSHNGDSVVGNTIRWVVPMSYLQTHKVQFSAEIAATPELLKGLGL